MGEVLADAIVRGVRAGVFGSSSISVVAITGRALTRAGWPPGWHGQIRTSFNSLAVARLLANMAVAQLPVSSNLHEEEETQAHLQHAG
jgi:hypothetical protein